MVGVPAQPTLSECCKGVVQEGAFGSPIIAWPVRLGRRDPSPNLNQRCSKILSAETAKRKHHVMWGTLVFPRSPTSPNDLQH